VLYGRKERELFIFIETVQLVDVATFILQSMVSLTSYLWYLNVGCLRLKIIIEL